LRRMKKYNIGWRWGERTEARNSRRRCRRETNWGKMFMALGRNGQFLLNYYLLYYYWYISHFHMNLAHATLKWARQPAYYSAILRKNMVVICDLKNNITWVVEWIHS
jgi:hypothetical protein